jgi:hypothetical protein
MECAVVPEESLAGEEATPVFADEGGACEVRRVVWWEGRRISGAMSVIVRGARAGACRGRFGAVVSIVCWLVFPIGYGGC